MQANGCVRLHASSRTLGLQSSVDSQAARGALFAMTQAQTNWIKRTILTTGISIAIGAACAAQTPAAAAPAPAAAPFGPDNPFYAVSTLPFQAPPFDKIKDSDYQPAIDAGMTQQDAEIAAIANNSQPPTFDNTIVE